VVRDKITVRCIQWGWGKVERERLEEEEPKLCVHFMIMHEIVTLRIIVNVGINFTVGYDFVRSTPR